MLVLHAHTPRERTEWRRSFPAAIMFAFAMSALFRWTETGRLYFLLFAFRDLLFGAFILRQEPAKVTGTRAESLLAWLATFVPLLYFSTVKALPVALIAVADLLAILGFLIATLATIELGTRLGFSPALRKDVCRTGLYRWCAHPMYVGYAIAESGWLLVDPHNILVLALSMGLQIVRAKRETLLLSKADAGEVEQFMPFRIS